MGRCIGAKFRVYAHCADSFKKEHSIEAEFEVLEIKHIKNLGCYEVSSKVNKKNTQ